MAAAAESDAQSAGAITVLSEGELGERSAAAIPGEPEYVVGIPGGGGA